MFLNTLFTTDAARFRARHRSHIKETLTHALRLHKYCIASWSRRVVALSTLRCLADQCAFRHEHVVDLGQIGDGFERQLRAAAATAERFGQRMQNRLVCRYQERRRLFRPTSKCRWRYLLRTQELLPWARFDSGSVLAAALAGLIKSRWLVHSGVGLKTGIRLVFAGRASQGGAAAEFAPDSSAPLALRACSQDARRSRCGSSRMRPTPGCSPARPWSKSICESHRLRAERGRQSTAKQ